VTPFEKRLGRDGKRRPVSAVEGRKRAAAYLEAHPDASLREVAREADVSVGTAHSMRRQVRHGTDVAAPVKLPSAPVTLPSSPAPQKTGSRSTVVTAGHAAPSTPELAQFRQQAWSAISLKIANDPALRYTEGGRAFLRWMTQHATHAENWRELVGAVPVHWIDDVTAIAESVSVEWHMFAAQLRKKRVPGS
jgi:transposase-like protein